MEIEYVNFKKILKLMYTDAMLFYYSPMIYKIYNALKLNIAFLSKNSFYTDFSRSFGI